MKNIVLFGTACLGTAFVCNRYYRRKATQNKRYFQWYKALYQWLVIQQDHGRISDYFKNNGYKSVAIYGMGELGKLLLKELDDADIEIPYVIDQNAGNIALSGNKKVIRLSEVQENVDLIVVSVIDKFDAIKTDIGKRVNVPVVSLEDVLFSL